MDIIQKPSPNFSNTTYEKDLIIIHKTLGLMPGTLSWLTNSASQVSAQYFVTKNGVIYQLVADDKMAWHSGRIYYPSTLAKKFLKKTTWGSYVNPNKYSIGIECEALINDKWMEKQMDSLVWLVKKIGLTNILTHKEITSYKPEMGNWRNEIVRRLKEPVINKDEEIRKHAQSILDLLK